MKSKTLAIDLLDTNADTQSRLKINQDVVEEYRDIIAEGNGNWPFPPLEVFHDGSDYMVADGFHRVMGALQAKRASIPCRVHKGTARDARIFAMTANDRHGLRMTRADKRACVEWLLDNGGKMPQKEIAEKAGVSVRTVRVIVSERKEERMKMPPADLGRQTSSHPTTRGGTAAARSENGDGRSRPAKASPPRGNTSDPAAFETEPPKLEDCPNCGGNDWTEDDEGIWCGPCGQPYGEPAGDPDEPEDEPPPPLRNEEGTVVCPTCSGKGRVAKRKESEGFDLFWAVILDSDLPKEARLRQNKGVAKRAYTAAVKRLAADEYRDPDGFLRMKVGLYALSSQANKEGAKFCPMASTWLNGEKYLEDEDQWNEAGAIDFNAGL